jgi:hypothetical protein
MLYPQNSAINSPAMLVAQSVYFACGLKPTEFFVASFFAGGKLKKGHQSLGAE